MVQPIDGAGAAQGVEYAAPQREVPQQTAADQPASTPEEDAVAQFATVFLTQVFMMTNQETEKIRQRTEQMLNEMREEE